MRRFGKLLGRVLLLLALAVAGLWAFGPREPVVLRADFDPAEFEGDVSGYFARVESEYEDIVPGTEKRVIWHGGAENAVTPLSIVYLHGFSGSAHEIRPVPDQLAEALGANLIYTRLQGHGRSGEALGKATVAGWMQDTAEALAAGRAVGEEVIVISTSTGGTLLAPALLDAEMSRGLKGAIFVSPNFGINNPMAPILTWPAARYWLPLLVGHEREFPPQNEDHAQYWTTRYPSVAVFPMAAVVEAARDLDYGAATLPALFYYSSDDQVVRPDITAEIAQNWGGSATEINVMLGDADDPYSHVVAGDTLSPGQTDAATQAMLEWIRALP